MIVPLALMSAALAVATRPDGLLCNLSPRAVGVDPAPKFSWIVPHLDACVAANRSQRQHSFEIEVATRAAGVVWRSGRTVSPQSAHVAGTADLAAILAPGTQYSWRVRVAVSPTANTDPGCLSDWSDDSNSFVTGLWDGWAPGVVPIWPPTGLFAFARTVVAVPGDVTAALAFAAAFQDGPNERLLGAYRLYVQNQFVTTGPGRGTVATTAPNHTLYDTIDILPFVGSASAGTLLSFGLQGYHHDAPSAGMVLEVHLTLADGSQLVFGTNASWHTFDADAVYNPTGSTLGVYPQPLEYINANHWQFDWPSAAFVESAGWVPAVTRAPATAITAKQTQPLQVEYVSPTVLVQTAPGKWFFDFGTEHMAGLRLSIPSASGAGGARQLSFVLGEELTGPTTVMSPLRTGNLFTGVWTLASAGASLFEHHEYMAWRYGELTFAQAVTCASVAEGQTAELQCTGGATITEILFASYGTPRGGCAAPLVNTTCAAPTSVAAVAKQCVGHASCSVPATNAFFGADPCHLTTKSLTVQVRCGAADGGSGPANFTLEAWRVQYPFSESDAAFDSAHAGLNQVWELCRNTIRRTSLDTFTDSNTRERTPYEADGYITAQSFLTLQRDFTWARHATQFVLFNPTWPTEWRQTTPILALQDYMATSDASPFLPNYALLVQNSQLHCLNTTTGLIDFNQCARQPGTRDVIDWPQASRDGYVLSNISTVISAYAVVAANALQSLARAWGFDQDADGFAKNASALTAGLLSLFDETTGSFVDGLGISHAAFQATIFPIWAGVHVPAVNSSQAILAFLNGKGMAGSVYAAYSFLGALYNLDSDHGASALEVLTNCGDNSWCNMLKQGATATMEAWTPAEKPNLSWSHPWATAPTTFIASGLMGITALSPGFATYQVKPQPGNLSWATLTRPTLAGVFALAFNQTVDNFVLQLTSPANTIGTVCLPALSSASRESTACTLVVNGTRVAGDCVGDYVCVADVGTGKAVISRF